MEPSDHAASDDADTAERVRSTRHSLRRGKRTLDYTADAGTLLVRRDDGEPLASMFYVAYRVASAEGDPARPVTFLFNGGPGSGSLWLNIGGFGPRRTPTATPAATGTAPYTVVDNPHTLLDRSDLVFLDAVGTGYSRMVGSTRPEEVWGVDQDIDVYTRAILRYLTITGSWNRPRFLFGESYGTTRAAGLVHRLQNQGVDFNGVVLLSTLLNSATCLPGTDQFSINLLPTMAATAWYHGDRDGTLAERLDAARAFARGPYAAALQLGDTIEPEHERRIADEMSALTGLDATDLIETRLRVQMEQFRHLFDAGPGGFIGRFDTRFVARKGYVFGTGSHDPATDDAATAGVNSVHLAAFREHLANDLGYESDLHYRPLHNMVISSAWDWHHKAPGVDAPLTVPDTSLDLGAAIRRNPALRVTIMGGAYDLATPFFHSEYDIAHLFLEPELRANVSFHLYEAGHMTFVDEDAITAMRADLDAFYDRAVSRH